MAYRQRHCNLPNEKKKLEDSGREKIFMGVKFDTRCGTPTMVRK